MSWLRQAPTLLDLEGGFEERERVSAQRDECPTECVCDRRGSMIDNLYRKRVSEKTLSIVRKLCKFCMRAIFTIFNLCNDWRICSIEYSVRFAHTARVCRWRSKPNRALVKGGAECVCWTQWQVCVHLCCLLDTELTNVFGSMRQERMNVCSLSVTTYERLLIRRDE